MELPICLNDAKSERLCNACARKMREGRITETDVRVSRLLIELQKKFLFRDVDFVRSIELGEAVVLVVKGNIGGVIGRKGIVVSELCKALDRKVRVIEETKDESRAVQDFLGKVRVVSVNKLFKPDSTEYKVMVADADRERLIAPKEAIEKGLGKLFNARVEVGFV